MLFRFGKTHDSNTDWKLIYLLPRDISWRTSCRGFQYKILNNVLYLHKMLFRFGKTCDSNLDWKLIYLLHRDVCRRASCRAFQYKILNNVLYLNKMLLRFWKTPSPLCSFCKLHDKILIHLFSSCNQVFSMWIEIKLFFPDIYTFVPTDCYFRSCKR